MELVAGQSLGRYEITGKLGAGGMGVVYRARDAQLGRDVAVKVLNDRAASQPSRIERFAREARAVARLSHPNILDIHDFGTHDGIAYAVTELLKGQTLADRIDKGPIPLNKGLEICCAVAKGLAAAHGEGIVHRDIKPSNIFITDTGQVKVLDFGIARLREQSVEESAPTSEAPTESMTGASRMVGTVGYMSPEQIDGGKVDGRSDIFSLGCVMYEVFTGRRAFHGKNSADTTMAILGKDPEPIRRSKPEVPQAVELIAERCLQKQPGERFESARDVAFALEAMSDARNVVAQPRFAADALRLRRKFAAIGAVLAVIAAVVTIVGVRKWMAPPELLPERAQLAMLRLSNSSDDPDQALLAAGLSRAIADGLTLLEEQLVGAVWVVPPGSTVSQTVADVSQLGRTWGLNLALAGELRMEPDRMVLTLNLVSPLDGHVVRTATIEDHPNNVCSLQEESVLRAVAMLGHKMNTEFIANLGAASTSVIGACTLYLEAEGLLSQEASLDTTQRALDLLSSAVAFDPLHAPSRIALARAHGAKFKLTQDEESIDLGLAEVARAIDSGPRIAEAHLVEAELLSAAGRLEEAAVALEEAVEARPEWAQPHLEIGKLYRRLRRYEEGEHHLERAMYLRPGYWPTHHWLARIFLDQGLLERAAVQFRRVVECAPQEQRGFSNLGFVYARLDRRAEAIEMFEHSIELEPEDNYMAYSNLGTLYYEDARYAEAATAFEQALDIYDQDEMIWGNLGWAYLLNDEPERSQKYFQRGLELAEAVLAETPEDLELKTRVASYQSGLGQTAEAVVTIESVVNADPQDPYVFASIAEILEELGDRDGAFDWLERALAGGVPPSRFQRQPTLRALIADDRYAQLTRGLRENGQRTGANGGSQ